MRIISREEKAVAMAGATSAGDGRREFPVKIGTDFIESVNGHIMVRCEHGEPIHLADDYPVNPSVENDQHQLGEDIFVMPKDMLAHKTYTTKLDLPILDRTIAVTKEKNIRNEDVTRLTSTDLEQTSTTVSNIVDDSYPNTKHLWPDTSDSVEIKLSAKYLKLIVDMVTAQSSKKAMEDTGITLKITAWNKPIEFSWKIDSYETKGALMPMNPK